MIWGYSCSSNGDNYQNLGNIFMSNQRPKAQPSLPKFMSENTVVDYKEENASSTWLANNLTRLMIGISVLWFIIVLIYITQFFGWSNLFLMMPDEFGGFLAGVTLPLAIIWVVMAYIDRGTSFKNEAKFLRAYMNQLVYPEEGGAQTAKAMADAIRSQVVELQEVTKHAMQQTDIIKQELSARVNDFAKLVASLDNYSSHTIVELTEGVKTLVQNFDYVANKAQSSSDAFKGYVSDFSVSAENMQQNCQVLFDKIIPNISELQKSSELFKSMVEENTAKMNKANQTLADFGNMTVKSVSGVAELLDSQTNKLDQTVQNVVNACDVIAEKINNKIVEIDGALNTQSENMDSQLDKITQKIDASVHKIDDVMVNQSVSVENHLNRISDQIKTNISHLDMDFQSQNNQIAQYVNNIKQVVNGSIGEVSEIFENQKATIDNYMSGLDDFSNDLTDKFNTHNRQLSAEVDKIVSRANLIDETIAIQVQNLQGLSDKITSDVKAVENNLNKSADNISGTSAGIIKNMTDVVLMSEESNNKMSALSEQYFNNTNSIHEDINKKHEDLVKISDSIMLNFKLLLQDFKNSVHTLQEQTDLAKAKLEDVSGVVKKNTDNLNEAASLVVAQSKVGESAFIQQQNNIEETINKIDGIKAELKYQIDELTRTSLFLSHESNNTVEQLKKQLAETFDVCNKAVSKAQEVNVSLSEQAHNFDATADQALGKVARMESILTTQSKEIEKLTDVVAQRSITVAENLEKHAANVNIATANSETAVERLSSSFAEQNESLNKAAEATIKHVADVVQTLDEKAENISLLFKQQENEFFNICDRLTENTDNMGNTLKKQVSIIEQSADKVFARMTLLDEDVDKRVDSFVAKTVKSIDKLAEVNESIAAQNNEVNSFIQEITDKMSQISEAFRYNFENFNNSVKGLTLSSDDFTSAIMANCEKINIANQNMVQESKNTISMLDSQSQNFNEFLNKTIAQSDLIKESFEKQTETLTDIANTVATQTRLGESSLAQQYKYLTDASVEISNKMNEINNQFKSSTESVLENSSKIAYEFNVLGDRLLKINEDVNKSSKDSIKNVEQMNISLGQLVDDMGVSINKSSAKIATAMENYEKYIANFNTVTAEASSGVFEINNLITAQSDKMIKISEDTKELVECFNTVLNDTSVQLSNRANMAYEKVKGLGENLKTLSLQMEEASKITATHFENSGNKLRATITEIASNAERISNEIRTSGEVFLKQSGVLIAAGDDTLKKVSDVMNVLNDTSSDFSLHGDELVKKTIAFNEVVGKQLKAVTDAAQKAEKNITDLENRYKETQIDTFLKDAGQIIERLETVSVDINRIFNPTAEEEIWKKYYNGDTGAFVRYLAKNMTKQQILDIKKLYEKNMEFRTLVTKYLSDFETLITRARGNEQAGILLSVISGADIGKIYYILAKALDKLN